MLAVLKIQNGLAELFLCFVQVWIVPRREVIVRKYAGDFLPLEHFQWLMAGSKPRNGDGENLPCFLVARQHRLAAEFPAQFQRRRILGGSAIGLHPASLRNIAQEPVSGISMMV